MTTPIFPAPGLFQHTDGGIYEVTGHCQLSTDASHLVAYRHVWPFEVAPWVRPVEEWASRFKPITPIDLAQAKQRETQADAQARITASRNARKKLS